MRQRGIRRTPPINAAGATFPYPIYSKWFDRNTTRLHPDVQINYQSIGSGGGIRQVIEGTVDFGATDGPMNDEQLKQFKDKHGVGFCISRQFSGPMFRPTTFRV